MVVPQANTSPEQDWHLHDVKGIDEVGVEEGAQDRRAPNDLYIQVAGRVCSEGENLLGVGFDEVEDRPVDDGRSQWHGGRRPRVR